MTPHQTELTSTLTVEEYKKLEQKNDRTALSNFFRQRFDERYFNPIESSSSSNKHGFTILAICCLVIETLESFYQGLGDTRGRSAEMFETFFKRDTPLKVFGGGDNWFFKDIRCGILHQSETRGGWRILRRNELLNLETKTINATTFLRELSIAVDSYAEQLIYDDQLWDSFKQKMRSVCDNCN